MNSHNTLSAASDERKARLAKLKGIKRKLPADDDESARPPPSDAATDAADAAATATATATATADADADAAPYQPPTQREKETEADTDVSRLHLSGRNYDPETRGPKLGFEAPPTLGLDAPTLEQQAAEAEARVRQQAAEEAQDDKGIDLFKLQPKKPNWDLKRNLDRRMELLNVRTDNAIARLVRERILGAQAAAAAKTATTTTTTTSTEKGTASSTMTTMEIDGEGAGVDGLALVEGLRVREREEQEEERREREEEEAEEAAAMGS